MSIALALVPCLVLAACSSKPEAPDDPDSGQPTVCFVGATSEAPEIEIVKRTVDGGVESVEEGSTVPLVRAPQGGEMLFVSVRARNMDVCPIRLTASLRDECDNAILALERRPVVLEDRGDGWAEPEEPIELSNYSNLPACPRAGLTRNIQGEPYLLKLTAEDKSDRKAELSVRIVPGCAEPDILEACLCECDRSYVLGEACSEPWDSGFAPGHCPGRDDAG